MSGHSKWSQIKRGKGIADGRRSAVFGKLGNAITLAARHGADPEMNFQLRIAIDKAKNANMPKDNIERAVERASGNGAATLQEIIFEIYGPHGTAFIVEAATDNHNRTLGEIRAVLNRHNGKLAEAGSVSYLFKKRGELVIPVKNNAEEIELILLDTPAEDYEQEGDKLYVYTEPKDLEVVKKALETNNIAVEEALLEYHPTALINLTDPEFAKKVIGLYDTLEELSDVTNIYSNFDVSE